MGCSSSTSATTKSKSKSTTLGKNRVEPLGAGKELQIEETFWVDKRKLIPDYERMRELDKHAVQASPDLKNSPSDLVAYLTKVARSDLERYRVLFRWEAENVDYDVEGLYGYEERGDNSGEGVLQSGKAVCEGYGALYKMLCDLAGLECVKLSGASKGGDYEPGDSFPVEDGKIKTDHAWNKIRIAGKWYLCDCTWAAGSVNFESTLGKMAYTRKWNEYYFISDPQMFTARHFPVDTTTGRGVPSEQCLDKPFADLNVWADEPSKDCAFFTFNMETVGQTGGVVETDAEETVFRVRCPHMGHVQFWAKLTELNEKDSIPRTGNKHPSYVMMYMNDDVFTCKVRFPHVGNYTLMIGVRPLNTSEELKAMPQRAVTYTIKHTGTMTTKMFPTGAAYDMWGANHEFLEKGFQVIGYDEPIIVSKTGRAELEVQLPDHRQPLLAELLHFSGSESEEMEGHVYGEKTDRKVKYHLTLPKEGEYRFTVMAKLRDDDKYWHGANFVVQNSTAIVVDEKFPHSRNLWGPGEEFHKLDIQSTGSSTLLAPNGSCQLKFSKDPEVVFLFNLIKNGQKYSDAEKYVFADCATDGKEFTFNARLPEKGYYKLELFAKNRNVPGSYQSAGNWLIDAASALGGELYPVTNGTWGAAGHFVELGLQVVGHKSAIIVADRGACVITIKAPFPITTTPYLSRNDTRLPEDEKKNCITIESDDTSISYSIKLPNAGFYKFELYGTNKGASSLPYLGCWLLDSKK